MKASFYTSMQNRKQVKINSNSVSSDAQPINIKALQIRIDTSWSVSNIKNTDIDLKYKTSNFYGFISSHFSMMISSLSLSQ